MGAFDITKSKNENSFYTKRIFLDPNRQPEKKLILVEDLQISITPSAYAPYPSRALATNGTMWVCFDDTYANIYSSPNGITWTARTLTDASFSQTQKHYNNVIYGNGIFMVVTCDITANYGNRAWTSPDGIIWTKKSEVDTYGIGNASRDYATMSFVDGYFYCNMGAGLLYRTTDGIAWTSVGNRTDTYFGTVEKIGDLLWWSGSGQVSFDLNSAGSHSHQRSYKAVSLNGGASFVVLGNSRYAHSVQYWKGEYYCVCVSLGITYKTSTPTIDNSATIIRKLLIGYPMLRGVSAMQRANSFFLFCALNKVFMRAGHTSTGLGTYIADWSLITATTTTPVTEEFMAGLFHYGLNGSEAFVNLWSVGFIPAFSDATHNYAIGYVSGSPPVPTVIKISKNTNEIVLL